MKRQIVMAMLMMAGLTAGAGQLQDPTRPPQPAVQRRPAGPRIPVVSAILVREGADGRSDIRAIVWDRWVRAGDEVGDGRVRAILPDKVLWVRGGKVHELRVANRGPSIKKPAASAAGKGDP